jgi:hypothetical protein
MHKVLSSTLCALVKWPNDGMPKRKCEIAKMVLRNQLNVGTGRSGH